eukprot:SAG11_NODE_968_length_6354_cov_16.546922_5_plen_128_part_00
MHLGERELLRRPRFSKEQHRLAARRTHLLIRIIESKARTESRAHAFTAVKNALALDAKLVPLYRKMAEVADANAAVGGAGARTGAESPTRMPPSFQASNALRHGGSNVASVSNIAEAEAVLARHFGK